MCAELSVQWKAFKVLFALLQIVIHSDNDVFPRLELTTFGTRQVFEKLKQVSLLLQLHAYSLASVHTNSRRFWYRLGHAQG